MSKPIDQITDLIIGSAIRIHKKYGPGLLESVYNVALALELVALGLEVKAGEPLPIEHEGVTIRRAYVLDLLVEDAVIVELKCVQKITDVHVAQLLTYLRLTDKRVGLLINFNVTKLVHGIRRVVNRHVDADGKPLPPPRRAETIEAVKKAAEKEEPE